MLSPRSLVEVERYLVVTRLASTTPSVSNLDASNCAAPGGSRGSWSRPGDLRRVEAGFWNRMICGVAITDISVPKAGDPVGLQLPLVCSACVTTPSLLTATSAVLFPRMRACLSPSVLGAFIRNRQRPIPAIETRCLAAEVVENGRDCM